MFLGTKVRPVRIADKHAAVYEDPQHLTTL
jgi:hypothetical protein